MRRIDLLGAAISLLLLASVASAAAEEVPSTSDDITSHGGGFVSPTVMATFIEHGEGSGMVLDVLVLWRGTPGWFLRSSGTSSGSAAGDGASTTIKMPGRDLRMVFDTGTRVARIQGEEVALGEANVILVDGIGTAEGAHVVGTAAVDRQLPDSSDAVGRSPLMRRPMSLETVLRRSPDLVSFVRCDSGQVDARLQAFATKCRMLTE